MNKTVNINLAGHHFHIDEPAYVELQRYLNAVKASLDADGRDEVMSDIEARISELFSEANTSDKQVITSKNVASVISIMGQPEDYLLEDEAPKEKTSRTNYSSDPRKYFRDTENAYIGGVSSGLSYYFGIDAPMDPTVLGHAFFRIWHWRIIIPYSLDINSRSQNYSR